MNCVARFCLHHARKKNKNKNEIYKTQFYY